MYARIHVHRDRSSYRYYNGQTQLYMLCTLALSKVAIVHMLHGGPGAGPWLTSPAAAHGLHSSRLSAAAHDVARLLPQRYCLVVVQNGEIIHESIFANSSDTRYESDSLAKTATALVIGAAVHAGLVDIDTPLADYGVKPSCGDDGFDCWRARCKGCPPGPLGFWPNQTARTLLAQTSGCVTGEGCSRPPTTAFTYDSEVYIQHLAHLLGHRVRIAPGVTHRTALSWASSFMAKLGLPDFYASDGLGDEFSAGGGQPLSCRGAARLAQLILNRGMWPTGAARGRGAPERLLSEAYVEQMLTPQYARRGYSYGLLTWLNAKSARHASSAPCCAPRWGPRTTCTGRRLETALLGDDLADLAPEDVALGMGWLGQYMVIVPSRNLSIVSLGATWGSSQQCTLGDTRPASPAVSDGYDDAWTASVLYNALDAATDPARSGQHDDDAHILSAPPPRDEPLVADRMHASRSDGPAMELIAEKAGGGGVARAGAPSTPYGSCSCACPPGRGFGGCYDLQSPPRGSTDIERCAAFLPLAPRDCPLVGVVRQCASPPMPRDADCATAGTAMRGDVGSPKVWGGHLNCSLRTPCRGLSHALAAHGRGHGSFEGSGFEVEIATCDCRPMRYGDFACAWSEKPCTSTRR